MLCALLAIVQLPLLAILECRGSDDDFLILDLRGPEDDSCGGQYSSSSSSSLCSESRDAVRFGPIIDGCNTVGVVRPVERLDVKQKWVGEDMGETSVWLESSLIGEGSGYDAEFSSSEEVVYCKIGRPSGYAEVQLP